MKLTTEYTPARVGADLHGIAVANLTRGHALIATLVGAGVVDFVVSPGARNTPVLVALEHMLQTQEGSFGPETLRVHRILDERAAGFVALGLSRARGTPAALVCTSGSAGANYFPALVEAFQAEVPLVVLSADRPPELQGCGAPQTIHQTHLFGHYARGFLDLGAPDADAAAGDLDAVTQLLNSCLHETPGPIHLNLPFRKPLWSAEAQAVVFQERDGPSRSSSPVFRRRAPADLGARFVNELQGAERGCIVLGPRCGAWGPGEDALPAAVITLGEILGWPVLAEPTSGVRFQGPKSSVIAMGDSILRSQAAVEALEPDYVLRFGQFPTSKTIGQWLALHGEAATTWVSAGALRHDPLGNVDQRSSVEPTSFCEALSAALQQRSHRPTSRARAWRERWELCERAAREVVSEACAERDTPLWEGAIAHLLPQWLPSKGALHVASSMPVRDLDSFSFPAETELRVFSSRGANGIDGTISTAIGEALAQPDKPMTVVLGDLATLHDLSGLYLLAYLQRQRAFAAPLMVVVVDNNGGGIFEHLPISQDEATLEQAFVTPQDAELEQLVAGLGLPCTRARSAGELGAAVDAALAQEGPQVIIATTVRASTVAKRRQVWAAVEDSLAQQFSSPHGEPR